MEENKIKKDIDKLIDYIDYDINKKERAYSDYCGGFLTQSEIDALLSNLTNDNTTENIH